MLWWAWLIWLALGVLASTAISGFLSGVMPDVRREEIGMGKALALLPVSTLIFVLHTPARVIRVADDAIWAFADCFCLLGRRVTGHIEEEDIQE